MFQGLEPLKLLSVYPVGACGCFLNGSCTFKIQKAWPWNILGNVIWVYNDLWMLSSSFVYLEKSRRIVAALSPLTISHVCQWQSIVAPSGTYLPHFDIDSIYCWTCSIPEYSWNTVLWTLIFYYIVSSSLYLSDLL